EFLHLFLEFAFAAANDGRHDHDAVVGGKGHDALDYLLSGLAGNGLAAIRAMGHSDGRVEQAQVIVDFGDGAYGRARTAAGGFLFDGNRRAEPIDRVDVGALHLIEKLAGVGGKRLYIAPLAFGIDRIESERGFAGAAQTRNDRQSIAGNLDVNILQVVLARAAHRNPGDGHLTQYFVDFRNVDGSWEMLESGDTQSDSRILVVNSGGGQMRIKLNICSRAIFTGWLPVGAVTVSALFVAFLIISTAILSVILGVFGAYCAITAVLAVVDPSRSSNILAALVPHQSPASGD